MENSAIRQMEQLRVVIGLINAMNSNRLQSTPKEDGVRDLDKVYKGLLSMATKLLYEEN